MAKERDKRPAQGVWEKGREKAEAKTEGQEFQKRLFSQVLGIGAREVRTSPGKKVAINHTYNGS